MCGIAGFIVSENGKPEEGRRDLLDRMCRTITHRGPDEQGMMVEGRAALGMRRLSIIDLKTGQQPIYNEDGRLAIVFNGEIYNFKELKKELESLGHKFKTNSDTETILHAFEEFGPACLEKLRGMFAFAIWDKKDESLFIARDRAGKKPLYYALDPLGTFIFGSEIKVLLEETGISKEIDIDALDSYIAFGYVPEETCIFKNIKKLPPAHYLTYKGGKIVTKQYWDLDYSEISEIKREEEYIEELRRLIREAVKIRLVSEVPLGAFLSGGVDSSSIVALMAEALGGQPVKTFSIGFNEDSFNELKFARIAAKRFNTDHHEFIVTPDLVEIVDDLIWHFDEPFADPSSLPTYMVSKMARDFVTVALSGDGGDELFAGYTRYVVDQGRQGTEKIPEGIRKGLFQSISRALPQGAPGKNYLYNVSLGPIERYIDNISHFGTEKRRALYSAGMVEKLGPGFGRGEALFQEVAARANSSKQIDKILYLDAKTYLPGDILTKVDRMSMAASLEARGPLLDHKLIEYATKIPAGLKLKNGETKYIFKKAMEGIVPDEILYREKQGFGVPINEWINLQLRDRIRETLTEQKTISRGYFNRKFIETMLDEHARKRRDHSYSLWVLFILELWHRKYIDN